MRPLSLLALLGVLLACAVAPTVADTPANCTYDDMLGYWDVFVSMPVADKTIDCTQVTATAQQYGIKFMEPNIAASDGGQVGNWTLIYNQGMELWMHDKIYTFLFAYTEQEESLCDRTQIGWLHGTDGNNWHCLRMQRVSPKIERESSDDGSVQAEPEGMLARPPLAASYPDRLFRTNRAYLDQVNAAQSYFTVGHYPEFEKMTLGELQRMGGSIVKQDMRDFLPPVAPHAPKGETLRRKHVGEIPDSWDWRNVSGVNYVTPVVSQGSCGSCYSFAATAMMEARIRIRSNMKQQPFLSNQDVVSCSPYSQGCNGGFPYLVAGKYGRDYGFLEEACDPYKAADIKCNKEPEPKPGCNPQRWYTAEYYYVGGYYGAATTQLIQEEILANGPIATSFMVLNDFRYYTGGVYTHQYTQHLDRSWNPFHLTNHVVVIVGWGTTNEGIPYWICKNSWGAGWGENGYFRILRGAPNGGEVSIESLVPSAIPILH